MDDELLIADPDDEVAVNLLDLAADVRGRVAPFALGRRLPAMIATLLRAGGLRARHGSATVVLDEEARDGPPTDAKGWAVLAGEPEEGEAIELSRRLGPARLLAFGELGPELTTGMTLTIHVLERRKADPVLELSRRFYTEETAGVAHDLAKSIAGLEGREEDVARLDPDEVLGTASPKALLLLQRGLDALEAIDAGLAGAELAPAAALLLEALEEDPACAPARQHVVTIIARLAEDRADEEVLELTEKLAALSPGDVEVTVLRARALQRAGELQQALALLEGVEATGTIAIELARLHLARGELEKALDLSREALKSARELIPVVHAEALEILGLALARADRVDEARRHFEQAVGLAADSARLWANLGRCHQLLGAPVAAAEAYQQSVELDPESWEAARNYAEVLVELGDIEGAMEMLRLWSEKRPDDLLPLLSRGELLSGRPADLDEARRLLEAGEARFPDDARLHSLLGGVLAQLGDHDAAETRYRRALELRPDDPALLSNLALVLSHLGRLTAAEPLARRAVELAPHDLICLQVLEHVRKKN